MRVTVEDLSEPAPVLYSIEQHHLDQLKVAAQCVNNTFCPHEIRRFLELRNCECGSTMSVAVPSNRLPDEPP